MYVHIRRPNLALTVSLALLLLGSWPTPARADGPPAPTAAKKDPPKYENPRYREDWSAWRCLPPCDRDDLTDRWKAIRLSQDGGVWMNVGGQVRFRLESWENQGFATNDSWLLTRLRLHADVHVGSHLRGFVEWIYADQATRTGGPRPIDENHHDLLNAFVDVLTRLPGNLEVGLRGGRQELLFGAQRLISPLDWANTRRTFDGASAWLKGAKWRLDAFAVRPVVVNKVKLDEWDENTAFAGLYFANKTSKCLEWEAYALYLHRDRATYLGTTAEEDRYTLGGRALGPIPRTPLDWEAEAAYQFGDFGTASISAVMATVEVGAKLKGPLACWEPRLALGGDYASGDANGAGGDLGTFNQLFPLGHAFFGFADFVGRQNVVAGRLTGTIKPTSKLTVRADFHEMWRAQAKDAVYNAGGGVLRAPAGNVAKHVMGEFDLLLKYKVDRHWELLGGWSHVLPGDFLKQTGPSRDADFFYAGMEVTF